MKLDVKPKLWEDRATLFLGYMINKGMQSSTVKSYLSAIKKTLIVDKYEWNDNLVLIRSLAKACRIINDKVMTRLPIHCGLLEMILFEVCRYFASNSYLQILYTTLFAVSYYGLLRVGEVTYSPHVLKAKNVYLGTNKNKILLILYSSKTHDESKRPQKINITANKTEKSGKYVNRYFCPFALIRQYNTIRGDYYADNDPYFIFKDSSPVYPYQARKTLKIMIKKIGLDSSLYGMHSFRIGRTTDLIKYRYKVEEVKLMGRWKSNVIFKYIR